MSLFLDDFSGQAYKKTMLGGWDAHRWQPAHARNAANASKLKYTVRDDGIHFLMQDGREEVICRITVEALSQLGRTLALTEIAEVFETGGDTIERAASDKYDQTSRGPYEVVTVTAVDLGLDGAT
jgi:hypothetical protein